MYEFKHNGTDVFPSMLQVENLALLLIIKVLIKNNVHYQGTNSNIFTSILFLN